MQNHNISLDRTLKLLPLVLFGLAYMDPMTVFETYGVGAKTSHGMLAGAYLLTLITMLFTGFSYGKMVKAFPVAGSAYTYVQKSISPHLGFVVGWVILLDYVLLPMINMLIAGTYLAEVFQDIPRQVWILFIIVVVTGVNIVGMKLNTKVNGILLFYVALVMFFFFSLSIKALISGTGEGTVLSIHPFMNADGSIKNVISGAALVSLSFLGFDAITTLSEETINPTKTIPKAILLVLLAAGIVFVGVAYFAYLVHPDMTTFENIDTASTSVAKVIGGHLFSAALLAGIVTATSASALAAHASAARLLFVMGRDNVFPKRVFGFIHPRFKTPILNLLIIGLLSCVGLFLNLDTASALINFGAFVSFIFVNISVTAYYFIKKKDRSIIGVITNLVFPMTGALMTLALWINLGFGSLSVGLTWLLIGIIYLIFLTKGFKKHPPQFDLSDADENDDIQKEITSA
ncbi:putrescine importer [Scopulibacillus daqui]|uniref:Putrescine importer n=1 Tax=Scopulibacillus daqui TaxID=1469162 RepID=A0ABS2Q3K9_9BACL|nr:APC family permease [Scopulibacillus daqui]MBM7646264.1 putrescine importer [Scopulibacillus daqui]